MRARGVPSPDEWDAVALTFAEPVRVHAVAEGECDPERLKEIALRAIDA